MLMYEHLDVVITIVVLCLIAFGFGLTKSLKRMRIKKIQGQVRELEVQVRMAKGPAISEHLHSIAKVYLGAGDPYTADMYYEKSIKALEREVGSASKELLPLLNEHLKLIERMKRKKDRDKVKQRIKEISQRQGQHS